MKYIITLLFLFSSIAYSQAPLTKSNRALDQDLKLCVNDGGVEKCPIEIDGPTGELILTGQPADCATSGSLVCGGVYTPSTSTLSNITTVTAFPLAYSRNGSTVTVQVRFNIDPINPATVSSFHMSLPIASNFASSSDGSGAGTADDNDGGHKPVLVSADSASDDMSLQWEIGPITGGATFYALTATLMYQIK